MRSNLGTKSRLAAHIIALVLLLIILVYVANPPKPEMHGFAEQEWIRQPSLSPHRTAETPERRAPANHIAPLPSAQANDTLDKASDHREAARTPQTNLRPPPAPAVEEKPIPTEETIVETPPPMTTEASTSAESAIAAAMVESPTVTPADQTSDSGAAADSQVVADVPPVAPSAQPDESQSLVIADPGDAANNPMPVLAPLANANLEVLGDGVYWLASRHSLEKELAAIPEIGILVFLSPFPGYPIDDFAPVRTAVVSAAIDDLSDDAAARFVHLASGNPSPAVVAVLPEARGAAFFKGAYLLAARNLEFAEVIKEIGPELGEADGAADEIVHRLHRLEKAAIKYQSGH